MSKTNPLPCPFCGDVPVIVWRCGIKVALFVGCFSTHCLVNPKVAGETREIAVENWNRRESQEERTHEKG